SLSGHQPVSQAPTVEEEEARQQRRNEPRPHAPSAEEHQRGQQGQQTISADDRHRDGLAAREEQHRSRLAAPDQMLPRLEQCSNLDRHAHAFTHAAASTSAESTSGTLTSAASSSSGASVQPAMTTSAPA